MSRLVKFFAAAAAFAAFGTFLGYFATRPVYRYADPDLAQIKLSLSHAADRVKPCIPLTPEQIAELAANMRRTETCERERLPVHVQMEIDGRLAVDVVAAPAGLWRDGPSSVYERLSVEPGRHRITLRLRDSANPDAWDYTKTAAVTLEAGRYFTVTFRAETGGFRFR